MDGMMDGIWALSDALEANTNDSVSRSRATVTRVDNEGVAWVHLPGGVDETPINGYITANVEPGDSVLVEIVGGRANVVGNSTSPSVSSREIERAVDPVITHVDVVESVAESAAAISEAINQHFWTDTQGIHVTQVSQEEWMDPTSPNYHSGPNVLLNSIGLLFRRGMTALASFTSTAVEFFTTAGTSVASFGASLVRIGAQNDIHAEVDSNGLRVTDGTTTPLDASVVGGTGIISGDNLELTDSLTAEGSGQFINGILPGTTANSSYITRIKWGTGNAVTNANGITTFNPGLGVKPSTVVVVMQHNAESEAIAKIAVPMIWSIDSASQVQVRWKRTDTNAWLASNRVCWTWLAIA